MTNESIRAAFERFWLHVVAKIGTKADADHTHDDLYYTTTAADATFAKTEAIPAKTSQLTNDSGFITSDDIPEVEIPEQVQADYNQNDEIAPDYIKNRPFYTKDPVENTLLNNVSVTIDSANGYIRSNTAFEIKAGQSYKVIFDGTEYFCEVYSAFGENVIGNGAIVGASGGNNEPFLLVNNYRFIYAASAGTHTITLVEIYEEVVQLPEKYIAYKPGKTVEETIHAEIFNDYAGNEATGDYSHAEGQYTEALGNYSHAEGNNTTAEGPSSHAEGSYTTASGDYSHAEGRSTTASGTHSHAQGYETNATGNYSHAEGQSTTASGDVAHAQGYNTVASGDCSHAEGWCTKAAGKNQHVQGKFNVEDTDGTYAHIVGNGSSDSNRSNAHTVDWNGNGWFAGTVEGTALILKSSTEGSNKKFKITIGDDGVLSVEPLQ